MGFKEEIDREKHALSSNKRPYETVSFLIFAILFLQQLFYLGRNIWLFIKNGGFFSVTNITAVGNLQNFFNRIVFIDSSKWIYVIAAIAVLGLYYFLVYKLVWNYLKKRNKAKWTWTLLIVFGPNILFMPPYLFYAIYVFRVYFFRFLKSIVEEYKEFDPKKLNEKEEELLKEEDDEAAERAQASKDKKESIASKEKE